MALLTMQGLLSEDATLAVLVGVSLLALVSLVVALMLLGRRQHRQDVRQIVQALEDLRSGRPKAAVEVDPRSPMAMAADAVNRLSEDLSRRWDEADNAREQLRAFLEAARDYAVVTTDDDWDIRGFSPGAAGMFGWNADEVLSRPAAVLFNETSWKDLLPKLARRALRERGVETRSVMVRRDGSTFHAELLVRQHRRGAEKPAGFLLVVKDVTGEVRLEDELRESEARYRALVEGFSEGVLILQEGRIVYANPAVVRLLGATTEDVEGRPLRDWVATRDVLLVGEAAQRIESQEDDDAELRCTLTVQEGEAVVEARIRFSRIVHGGKPAALASVFDETLERRVEDELRQNERRLDAVLEATSDGVLVLASSPEGGVVRMTNRAFLDLFDLDPGRVLGASEGTLLRTLRHRGGGAESIAAALAAVTASPRTESVALTGDPPRMLEVKIAPLVGRNGGVLGRVLAIRDVTDQKTIERRLQASADELRRSKVALEESHRRLNAVNEDLKQRARQLDRANKELRTLDEMKSNLLANVSHELQTPLVSIRGYTEMVLKGRLGAVTEEQRKGLSLSLKNVDRLIGMIDNLLSFSRMDEEAASLNVSRFPLRPLIDEALALLQEGLTKKEVAAAVHLPDERVTVEADRDRILQVFLNLISNGIKFNRPGGRLEIAARRGKPSYLIVQVRDTGIGIPKEAQSRIFDRFYRVTSPASGEVSGSGIGLAIVRNILRLHGCTIRVESQVGRGSTFAFTLPLAGEKSRPGERAEEEPAAGPDGNRIARERSIPAEPAPKKEREGPARPKLRVIRH